MVAMFDSREIHTDTQRLNNDCTVFQAEVCGIRMAIDWIQNPHMFTFFHLVCGRDFIPSTPLFSTTNNRHCLVNVERSDIQDSN